MGKKLKNKKKNIDQVPGPGAYDPDDYFTKT